MIYHYFMFNVLLAVGLAMVAFILYMAWLLIDDGVGEVCWGWVPASGFCAWFIMCGLIDVFW